MAGREIGNVEKGPDFLLHVILDFTVDGKVTAIEALEEDIETAEARIVQEAAVFRLQDLVHLRRASSPSARACSTSGRSW